MLSTLEVNPSNKEVKHKLQQVSESLQNKTKRELVPTGLGIGLVTLKRKFLKKSADGATNGEGHMSRDVVKDSFDVGNRGYECKQVEGLKEDNEKKNEMMDDCENGGTFEGHEESGRGEYSGSRLECEKTGVNNTRESTMQEVADLRVVNPSNLKTIYPAELNYRFGNQKKAGSYLLISKKDY